MPCFAGLDVSLKTTSICVLDQNGGVIKRGKVASEPADIAAFLRGLPQRCRRVILEASGLSRWLYDGLSKAGLPVVVVETRHAHRILGANRNKTDRNDARGLADMAWTGRYRVVLVKSAEAQQTQALMTARGLLVAKAKDMELAVRGILRSFGLKMGRVPAKRFDDRVKELVGGRGWLSRLLRPLQKARALMREEARYIELDLIDAAKADPICRRLMTAPGVGPIVALTYKTAIDEPARFRRSRSVGAFLGLTQRISQSGELVRRGRISCWGDREARRNLFMGARSILRPHTRPSWLRSWGLEVAAKHGALKAFVAVARRLAVILHRMWLDETDFRREEAPA